MIGAGRVADADVGAGKRGAEFRDQFFHGVGRVADQNAARNILLRAQGVVALWDANVDQIAACAPRSQVVRRPGNLV